MPDQNLDVLRFSRYFNIEAPSSPTLALIFLFLGVTTGLLSAVLLNPTAAGTSWLLAGISTGITIITVPGILTVFFLKTIKRKIKLKHAFVGVLAISFFYSMIVIIDTAFFSIFHNYALAYSVIILINASIYVYWFLMNRVILDHGKSRIITASFQPVLNVLLFIPASKYLFNVAAPIGITLIKLWSGMAVFLIVGYIILYIMDRPAKRELQISGVELLTAMVNQWMYDITNDGGLFKTTGVKRDVNVDVLALKGSKGYKAVFVRPDIHYGPFHDIGGSVATENIGRKIEDNFKATPFVMHGAVSFEDNPVSTRQLYKMSSTLAESIASLSKSEFKPAKGSISFGSEGPCKAICIGINESCILTLTKAPMVTEDIEKQIGKDFEKLASRKYKNTILVDAHNSRSESAHSEELKGIYPESKYVQKYKAAIEKAVGKKTSQAILRFGSYGEQLSKKLKRNDLGNGYASVAVFEFGGKPFSIIYLDANNILPSFREAVIKHIKNRFNIDVELCTTDTHSVNTIALPASNVLGNCTKVEELVPLLDVLISKAMNSMEAVSCAYKNVTIKGFKVWGRGTDDALLKASREVIHAGKRTVPLVIAAGFIIAAWVIYLT